MTTQNLNPENDFKPIIGYEDYYEVNRLGVVRSKERKVFTKSGALLRTNPPRILKSRLKPLGYYYIGLNKDGFQSNHYIHRLIAIHFIPNPDNKPQINHIDCNPSNNSLSNLEWTTQSENIKHGYNLGRIKSPTLGKKHTDESRAKMSRSRKGMTPWNKGRHITKSN